MQGGACKREYLETDTARCFHPALLVTFRRLQSMFTSLRECTEMNYMEFSGLMMGRMRGSPKKTKKTGRGETQTREVAF